MCPARGRHLRACAVQCSVPSLPTISALGTDASQVSGSRLPRRLLSRGCALALPHTAPAVGPEAHLPGSRWRLWGVHSRTRCGTIVLHFIRIGGMREQVLSQITQYFLWSASIECHDELLIIVGMSSYVLVRIKERPERALTPSLRLMRAGCRYLAIYRIFRNHWSREVTRVHHAG